MNIAFYRLLLGLLSPPLWIFLIVEGRKRQGGYRFWLQRAGLSLRNSNRKSPQEHTGIWFHAASVGELRAVEPLIRQASKSVRVLVTTNTPEAARLLESLGLERVVHRYCPLDYAWAMRRLITVYNPRSLIIAETELWPNMLLVAAGRGLPIHIANGRLTERTVNVNGFVRSLYRRGLEEVTGVWARSQTDAANFIALGCPAERVQTLGNIKFMAAMSERGSSESATELTKRPYVLALSTHQGEEAALARVWAGLVAPPLLIIIPRHPPRGVDIRAQLIALGVTIAQRSRAEAIEHDTQIYLADSVGEVSRFLPGAEWVFVGGSLVDVGGHNFLEPAAQGKCVVSGPSLSNFKDEANFLLERKAMLIVRDENELRVVAQRLLTDNDYRVSFERQAGKAMAATLDIGGRYQSALAEVLAKCSS